MKQRSIRKTTGARGRRDDGASTKANILNAAGEVFAEKGFDRATGKEIAERAGTNSAAVNYYYGGIEGLYAEVLVEAHRRLLAYDQLVLLAEAPGSPEDHLCAFIDRVARTVTGPSSIWPLRVMSREVLAPTSALPVLMERELLPKRRVVIGMVAAVLGVPPDHPAVVPCLLNIMAPFAMMLVVSRQFLSQVIPGLGTELQAEQLAEHFKRYALAGLAATAAGIKSSQASKQPPLRRKAGKT